MEMQKESTAKEAAQLSEADVHFLVVARLFTSGGSFRSHSSGLPVRAAVNMLSPRPLSAACMRGRGFIAYPQKETQ